MNLSTRPPSVDTGRAPITLHTNMGGGGREKKVKWSRNILIFGLLCFSSPVPPLPAPPHTDTRHILATQLCSSLERHHFYSGTPPENRGAVYALNYLCMWVGTLFIPLFFSAFSFIHDLITLFSLVRGGWGKFLDYTVWLTPFVTWKFKKDGLLE